MNTGPGPASCYQVGRLPEENFRPVSAPSPGRDPFSVDAIYHDGRFTYIKASPEETPALYELKDGKPNLVNFDYRDGVFVVPKILGTGYLAIGREKLRFALN